MDLKIDFFFNFLVIKLEYLLENLLLKNTFLNPTILSMYNLSIIELYRNQRASDSGNFLLAIGEN